MPLHHQVYLDLRGALDAREWGPGDRLPTERELSERYGTSLITVRRALSELVHERRVQRTPGRGTFVTQAPIDFPLLGAMSFTEEMRRRGLAPRTRVIGAVVSQADGRVAETLELPAGAQVIDLERLRIAGGVPVLLERARLQAERFPGLLDHDLERGSLYDLLDERFGVRVARAREWMEPVLLGGREARLLEVEAGRPGLFIEGIAHDQTGGPVEYATSWMRGDGTRTYLERDVGADHRPADDRPAGHAGTDGPSGLIEDQRAAVLIAHDGDPPGVDRDDPPAAVLAIDGGNSKTDLVLADAAGTTLAQVRSDTISHQQVPIELAMARLDGLVGRALAKAGLDQRIRPVARVAVMCLAGADFPSTFGF